jgi:hypothetical protein
MTKNLTPTSAESLADLRGYLEMVAKVRSQMPKPDGFKFNGIEEFVLSEGRAWTAQPRPESVPMMTPKYCFDNSYRLAARSRGRLRYVEGFATSVIPMHHAWTVDSAGNVVDPTWEYKAETAYFGVEFPLKSVRAARGQDNTSVLSDWKHDFPVLRGVVPTQNDSKH